MARCAMRRSSARVRSCCFQGRIRSSRPFGSRNPLGKLDFISLMLALFLGTASLPHILIRYYTVKDAPSAMKSTVV